MKIPKSFTWGSKMNLTVCSHVCLHWLSRLGLIKAGQFSSVQYSALYRTPAFDALANAMNRAQFCLLKWIGRVQFGVSTCFRLLKRLLDTEMYLPFLFLLLDLSRYGTNFNLNSVIAVRFSKFHSSKYTPIRIFNFMSKCPNMPSRSFRATLMALRSKHGVWTNVTTRYNMGFFKSNKTFCQD